MAASAKTIRFVVSDPSALATACAALASGANAAFASGQQSSFTENDLSWQTAFYHDDGHGLIHLMGKPANSDTQWKHQYYTVATNTWTVVLTGAWNNPGHIYGNFTMDFVTGDVFQQRGFNGVDNVRRLRRWDYTQRASGAAAWGLAPINQDMFTGNEDNHGNGVCYHPNLYGTNDGGAIWSTQSQIHFWRRNTDGRQTIGYTYGAYGEKEGANCYWPAQNSCFVGGSAGPDGNNLLRVTPNVSAGGTPVLANMGTPPIRCQGASHLGGSGFGSLHVHPGNPNKMLLIETAGSRVYETSNGSTWTQISNHPFTMVPRVLCSLRGGLGCVWAIGRNSGGTHYSQLWKPAP
jgi:hypothetical protein